MVATAKSVSKSRDTAFKYVDKSPIKIKIKIKIKIELHAETSQYPAVTMRGYHGDRAIGYVFALLIDKSNYLYVQSAHIHVQYQRKGYGSLMYKILARFLFDSGWAGLKSRRDYRSDAAAKLWKKIKTRTRGPYDYLCGKTISDEELKTAPIKV